MSDGFVHLRVRSAYSLLEGAIKAYDMGKLAGTMLLERLNGKAVKEKKVVSPVRLECRDSTRR